VIGPARWLRGAVRPSNEGFLRYLSVTCIRRTLTLRTIARRLCGRRSASLSSTLELKPASTSLQNVLSRANRPQIAPQPRRVLIVLMGSIGDVVRALPRSGASAVRGPMRIFAWPVEPKSEGGARTPIAARRNHRVRSAAHAPWTFIPSCGEFAEGQFDLVIDLQRHLKVDSRRESPGRAIVSVSMPRIPKSSIIGSRIIGSRGSRTCG